MLKASDNIHTSRRAGKKMVIARSKDELIDQYQAMEDGSNPSLMIQEYIPGGDDSVWMLNGYFDEHSDCLFSMTAKKIHQTPVYTGMTALGICLPNPAIESATKTLVKAVGYKGILDIGYRYDARDGLLQTSGRESQARCHVPVVCRAQRNGRDSSRIPSFHWTAGPCQHTCASEGNGSWKMPISCRAFGITAMVLSVWELAWELSWNPGVRMVCGGRHRAVSSYVFRVSHKTLAKNLQEDQGVIQIGLGKGLAACTSHFG